MSTKDTENPQDKHYKVKLDGTVEFTKEGEMYRHTKHPTDENKTTDENEPKKKKKKLQMGDTYRRTLYIAVPALLFYLWLRASDNKNISDDFNVVTDAYDKDTGGATEFITAFLHVILKIIYAFIKVIFTILKGIWYILSKLLGFD